jgi:predicted enzyme related to lactoylglutathione lyase
MMLSSSPVVAFIPTSDFDRARTFYVDTLGLTFLRSDGFAMVLESGSVNIRVVKVEFKPAPYTILGWSVENIETAVTELTAKGVAFERYDFMAQDGPPIWTSPGGSRVAWFKDPDGNVLSLSHE